MKAKPFLCLAICLVSVLSLNLTTSAQNVPPGHLLRERSVRRAQPVFITPPRAGAASTTFRLFPDVAFDVNWTRVERQDAASATWFGKVAGAQYGQAVLVANGNSLIASVTRGDGMVYQVRTADDGTPWSVEIDQSQLADDYEPLPMVFDQSPVISRDPATAADDGSIIDVLVLYTPASRQAVGGTATMQALVQLGIAETNQGYTNSNVTQRVRLVAAREVSYTESSAGISTDLTRLRSTTDGFIDEAHLLRDAYGADLVSLWVDTTENTCGVGYIMTSPTASLTSLATIGFSVTEQRCATGNYTFAHEMGHNMGAHHSKDDLNSDGSVPVGAYPYANGYKQTTSTPRFRTIMAYDAGCSCPRLDYWSNPNVNYQGLPMGVDSTSGQSAANYLVLNNTAPVVANYRTGIVLAPGGDSAAPLLTLSSHSNNQTVPTSVITLAGLSTDAGRGDSGISSITINGIRAEGDSTAGNGLTAWSRTLTLTSGANPITIVARDNSAAQNSTTLTLTINVVVPTSVTSSTYHVFPQFADGNVGDGTYYRSTLMMTNPGAGPANCTFRLYGLTVNGAGEFAYSLAAGSSTIVPFSSNQSIKTGYGALQCSSAVEAQLLYSFYVSAGVKLAEATVFSSRPSSWVQIPADNRDGSRIAIAIANDSDTPRTYNITAFSNTGSVVDTAARTVNPRRNLAAFIDELVTLPANYYGQVYVVGSGGETGSVIGIRFTGSSFTTIPAVARSAVAPTAMTYHVFPQFADGRMGDGSYYRTTVIIINPSGSTSTCQLRLYGLQVNGVSLVQYVLGGNGGWTISNSLSSNQTIDSGYATLNCTAAVEAQLLYSFYSASGVKLSEATVFSSPSASSVQVLADQRGGSDLGIAIANDSDQIVSYDIIAYDSAGTAVAAGSEQLTPRSNTAKYLSQFIPNLPANFYGAVVVNGSNGAASIIGIRYTGSAFTTIPETLR